MPPEAEQLGEPTTEIKITGADGPLNVFEATRALKKAREEAYGLEPAKEAPPDDAPLPGEAPSEPAQASEDAAPPTEAPGEQAKEPEPELPAIDPPRSWTTEEKERFNTLPRETQQYLAERERERDRAFNQRQQEAAERAKTFEVERQRAEQARAAYESALPQMLGQLHAQLMGEFADVRSWQDVERMAAEDPFRYQRFQVAQQRAAAAQQELQIAQQRQQAEYRNQWANFAREQDNRFAELAPELADTAKARELRENAVKTLRDVGFKDQELAAAWEGQAPLFLRDARLQALVRDATLYRQAIARSKQAAKAKVPPVQSPGTARPSGVTDMAEIQSLQKQLETASGANAIRIATRLTQLRRNQ